MQAIYNSLAELLRLSQQSVYCSDDLVDLSRREMSHNFINNRILGREYLVRPYETLLVQ